MKLSEDRQLAIADGLLTSETMLPASEPSAPERRPPQKKRHRLRVLQGEFFVADPHPADRERAKGKSLGIGKLTRDELLYEMDPQTRAQDTTLPENRGACEGGPRPCPMVLCRHHLFGFITPSGAYKRNFPSREPDEMPERESCDLDVADDSPDDGSLRTFEEVGRLLNVTPARAQQLEVSGFKKLLRSPFGRELAQMLLRRRRK